MHAATFTAVLLSTMLALTSPTQAAADRDQQRGAAGHADWLVNADDDRGDGRCDATHCNLREAIAAANRSPRGGTIRFALPVMPYHIEPLTPLPALADRIVIDGETQPGAECPMPLVVLSGAALEDRTADGLVLAGDDNVVRGLAIIGFGGNGVLVRGDENLLECLYVGIAPDGAGDTGNGGHGIAVVGGFSNRIGGEEEAGANILSANTGQGLYIESAFNTLLGINYIGMDALGRVRLPNLNTELPTLQDPPPPSPLGSERAVAAVTAALERRAQGITDRQVRALDESGLYGKYVDLVSDPDARDRPSDLNELFAALAGDPALFAAFIEEANAVVEGARRSAATHLSRVADTARRLAPAFGRDAETPELERRDIGSELLDGVDPGDYVVSGAPSTIIATAADQGPIAINALTWNSLSTYGPTSSATPLNAIPTVKVCEGPATPCYWPIVYDLFPWGAQLLWESSTLTAQQVEDIVTENGYQMSLRLNNLPLYKGPWTSNPPIGQSYWASSAPGYAVAPCPTGKNCIAINLFVRDRLADIPFPWTFELEVKELTELDEPQIIGVDGGGNLIIATHSYVTISKTSRTVQANPSSGNQSWFESKLYPTFQHPRCADCHGFENFEGIAQHHLNVWNVGSVDDFITQTQIHLQPSLYVPGAHVMACYHCHQLHLTDPDGVPFHEIEWLAPHQDLDVNWSQKTASQACQRVLSNLPTSSLRTLHFHGDSRLFWAVQEVTPPTTYLSQAPPANWDEFLRRVDLWNIFGAPCP